VCGGGNGAHALIGTFLMTNDRWKVRAYLPLKDERRRFKDAITSRSTFDVQIGNDAFQGDARRVRVTGDAEEACRARLIAIVVPAFAHRAVLSQISDFLGHEHVVLVLPARSGFEYEIRALGRLGERGGPCVIGFQTLPWACRTNRFGQSVMIYGAKRRVGAASFPNERILGIKDQLSRWLNIPVVPYGSMLELSLANTGQLIHPGIMYASFADRRDEVFPSREEIPLFYTGVDEHAAAVLSAMSDEILAIRMAMEASHPGVHLPKVVHLSRWLHDAYGDAIEDSSSLARMFQTNSGYQGLTVPVTEAPRGYRIDVHARYLTEDLPFGLAVSKGIASIMGIPTPTIDEVITHTSRWIGKEYLVGGKLTGRDVDATRAPQRFGIGDVTGLIA